jgi:cytochrome P450 family 307 subfamily A
MVLTATLCLLAVCVVLLGILMILMDGHSKKLEGSRPPGPKPWPVIGSLHLLAQYKSPFEALTNLSKVYGEIYSITLGTKPCVVVNTFPLIKEVLITKGSHFGDRPNFIRFHKLFGGDRNNCKFLTLPIS